MNKPEISFGRKKPNTGKLLTFGFSENNGNFMYSTAIADGKFKMTAIVTEGGAISTKVIDVSSDEEYVMHRIPAVSGSFVGAVRTDYENILREIAEQCFEPDVFKSECTRDIIRYVRHTYQDELEFLWQPFSDNAIFRRKDTGKWYGALLALSRRKLGFDSEEIINIINLKVKAESVESIVDGKRYFKGYHMNKKHWITICLDGSVPTDEIFERIDTSYKLAVK